MELTGEKGDQAGEKHPEKQSAVYIHDHQNDGKGKPDQGQYDFRRAQVAEADQIGFIGRNDSGSS